MTKLPLILWRHCPSAGLNKRIRTMETLTTNGDDVAVR